LHAGSALRRTFAAGPEAGAPADPPDEGDLNALFDRAMLEGRIRESEIEQIAEERGMSSEQVEDVRDQLAACGIVVDDDLGRPAVARATPTGCSPTTPSTRWTGSWPKRRVTGCSARPRRFRSPSESSA
jgi:hypothetical protein